MVVKIYISGDIWNLFLFFLVLSEQVSQLQTGSSESNFFPLINEDIDKCSHFYDAVCRVHENEMKNDKNFYDEKRDGDYIVNKLLIDNFLSKEESTEEEKPVDQQIAKKLYKQCSLLDPHIYKQWMEKEKTYSQTDEEIDNEEHNEIEPESPESSYKPIVDKIEEAINSYTSGHEPKTLRRKWFKKSLVWIGSWPMATEFCSSKSFDFASGFVYLTMSEVDPIFELDRKGYAGNAPITVSPGSLILKNPLYYNDKKFPDQVLAYRKLVYNLVHSYRKIVLRIPRYDSYDFNLDYNIDLLFDFESKLAKLFLKFRASNAHGMQEFSLSMFNKKWNQEIDCEEKYLEVNWLYLLPNLLPNSLIEAAKELKISVPKIERKKGKVDNLVSSVAALLDTVDPFVIADYFGVLWSIKRGTVLFAEFRKIYRQFLKEAFGKDMKSIEFQCASIISKYMDSTMSQAVQTIVGSYSQDGHISQEKSAIITIVKYLNTSYLHQEKDKNIIDSINNIEWIHHENVVEYNATYLYYEPFSSTDNFSMVNLLDAGFPDILQNMIFISKRRRLANYFPKESNNSQLFLQDFWDPNIAIYKNDILSTSSFLISSAAYFATLPIVNLLDGQLDTGLFTLIGTKIVRAIFKQTLAISPLECDEKEDYDRIRCYNEVLDQLAPGSKTDEATVEDVVNKILTEVSVANATFGAFIQFMETSGDYDTKEDKDKGKRQFFEILAKQSCAIYNGDMAVAESVRAGVVPMRVIIDVIASTEDFKLAVNCP